MTVTIPTRLLPAAEAGVVPAPAWAVVLCAAAVGWEPAAAAVTGTMIAVDISDSMAAEFRSWFLTKLMGWELPEPLDMLMSMQVV